MKTRIKNFAVAGALSVGAALSTDGSAAPGPESTGGPQREVMTRTDLQDLIQYFREQRAEFLAARRLLMQQLAAAQTVEEKRQILAVFAEQNRERILEQAEFRRQFRMRQMEIRLKRRGGSNPGG